MEEQGRVTLWVNVGRASEKNHYWLEDSKQLWITNNSIPHFLLWLNSAKKTWLAFGWIWLNGGIPQSYFVITDVYCQSLFHSIFFHIVFPQRHDIMLGSSGSATKDMDKDWDLLTLGPLGCCLCFGKPQPFVALRINLAPFRWKPGENMRMCRKPVSENIQKTFRKWWCGCETAIQEFYDRRHGSMANFWAVSLWHIWCDVFS